MEKLHGKIAWKNRVFCLHELLKLSNNWSFKSIFSTVDKLFLWIEISRPMEPLEMHEFTPLKAIK